MPDLDQLVREAIRLTGAESPALLNDDAPVLQIDDRVEQFYLVGLIGGKEVGKSALVNALVGQQITDETAYGPGTEIAVAYAHESQRSALAELLDELAPQKHQIITHSIDHLRQQVLLDLPDIDSRYHDHVDLTRRMLRHMLFPVWVQSVEKYADQQPQKLLAAVAAGNDPHNFIFCLNKCDQLADEQAVREITEDFANRVARTLDLPSPPEVYAVSAVRPEQHDLPRLKQLLSRQRSADAVTVSKQLAMQQRERSILRWLIEQKIDQRAARLKRLEEQARDTIVERLATPLLDQVLPQLADDAAVRAELADRVLQRRVARWPIVNILHVLLQPLVGMWRQAVAPTSLGRDAKRTAFHAHTPHLSKLTQACFAQLHQAHPIISDLYRHRRLWDESPAETETAELHRRLNATLQRQAESAADRLTGHWADVTSPLRWLLTIGALLWFPFIQPVVAATLDLAPVRLGIVLVQMFSVTHLLTNLAFLAGYFAVIWLVLKWNTQRRVERLLCRWNAPDAADATRSLSAQTLEWLDQLLDPIRLRREEAERLAQRIEEARQQLSPARASEAA